MDRNNTIAKGKWTNRKNNNELKEVKKVIIWLNMKISGNTRGLC
jgi:hypothetical protein